VKEDFLTRIEMLASSNVDIIILREKDLTPQEYEKLSEKVLGICQKYKKECILHTFDDVAKKLGCKEIHLSMGKLRKMSEEQKLYFKVIGASVHSVEEAKEAEKLGATYITASHIFATMCKAGLEPRGLDFLRQVVNSVDIPVYALGGIKVENISDCIQMGAAGVCIMSEFMTKELNSYFVKKYLYEFVDKDYQKFSSSLIPNCNNMIGVRIPQLRKLAKGLAKGNYRDYLSNVTEDTFEETMLQGLVIGYVKCEIDEKIKYIEEFIPKIKNWSINDVFCSTLKFVEKNREQMYEFISKYVNSNSEFEQRFVAVMMMYYYLNDEYIDRVLKILDGLKNDGYYTKMGVAWAIATAYAKYPEKTYAYLVNGNSLDKFTFNKSLQKMIESYRVSADDKVKLRALKI
jgi:thiamine-phosphate diphosphorylase